MDRRQWLGTTIALLGSASTACAQAPGAPAAQTGLELLKGRWVRPDGGYVITIRDIASDGKLTNVQPTDRPASDPAVQCILGLVKGAKLDAAGRSKFTSAFFHYSFNVY